MNTILHPTDFSPSAKAALGYAVGMARQYGASLHLLNVAPSLGEDPIRFAYEIGSGEEALDEQMKARAEQMVAALREDIGGEDLDIVPAHDRGVAPGPVIVDYAGAHDVDLIVMGTHGRRGVRRLLLGSVAEEVVRRATCSVLTVRGERDGVVDPLPIDRMLVPVDFSAFTVPLFRAAKEVAATYDARIDLLHVVEPLPFPVPLLGAVTIHDLVPDPTERAEEQLAHLIERVEGPTVAVEAHVEEGHAAALITKLAEALESDLLMIASHGLSGLEGLLLGSVTARVVRRADCPVWVARLVPEEEDVAA